MSPGKFSGVTNTGQYHINTFECSALVISSAPQVWPKKDTLANRRTKKTYFAQKKTNGRCISQKVPSSSTYQVNTNNIKINFPIILKYAVSTLLAAISMKSFFNSNILFLRFPGGSTCLLFGATSFSRHSTVGENRTLSWRNAPERVCQLVWSEY